MKFALVVTAALLAGAYAPAFAAQALPTPPTPVAVSVVTQDDGKYSFQVDSGHFIYSSDKDQPNKSNCTGPCALEFVPVEAPDDAKPFADWTVVTRDDKTRQWAYKGKPIYTFAKEEPGERKGVGSGWQIVTP